MRRRKTKGVIVRDGQGLGFWKNRGRDRRSRSRPRGYWWGTRLRDQGKSKSKLETTRKMWETSCLARPRPRPTLVVFYLVLHKNKIVWQADKQMVKKW